MFTITILRVSFLPATEFTQAIRTAYVLISDGTTTYSLHVGNLPIDGSLQDILEAQAADLWPVAVATNHAPTVIELSLADGLQWFLANPGTQGIFTGAIVEIETWVGNRVDLLFPSATPANKNPFKKFLTALAVAERINMIEDLGPIF